MKKRKILVMFLAVMFMISSVAPIMVSAQLEQQYISVYRENFENSAILDTIKNKQDGWNLGAASDADAAKMQVDLGNNLGLDSNAIRFDSTNWWGNMWMTLDVEQNGIAKKVANGEDQTIAKQEVDNYLSGDMRVSFQLYFKCDGIENNCKYLIKLKDSNQNVFATLQVTEDKDAHNSAFDLVALNETKTQNKLYNIATGDSNVFSKQYDVSVLLRKSDNTYQMSINGTPVSTDNGTWIPASNSASVGAAAPYTFGDLLLNQLEFDHSNSGWWQTVTVDNIDIAVLSDIKSSYVDSAITNVSQVSSGSSDYDVQAAFTNNKGITLNTKAIYALYDANNNMIGITVQDLVVDGTNGTVQSPTISCSGVPVKGIVLVWDGLDTMSPLSSSAIWTN